LTSLHFFAVREDHKAIIDFILEQTDARIFELYSVPGQDLRQFRSFDELAAAHEVGIDTRGSILLSLWSPSVMDTLEIEKIVFKPAPRDGPKFKYTIEGFGLISLYLGGVFDRAIITSEYGHNSLERARKWGYKSGVNWDALKKLSNKIQYHIRNRLAVARVSGRPILAGAYELVRSGYALKDMAQSDHQYDSALIKLIKARSGRRT
jgi:hypothetical protein